MTEFAPGQRWTYRTRPGEETSTALILAVDPAPEGREIVSVSLNNLRISARGAPTGVIDTIQHLPVDAANVRASVLELIEENVALPEDNSGYEQWRGAYDREEAGVFTLDLAEVVGAMQQAVAPQEPNDFGTIFKKGGFR